MKPTREQLNQAQKLVAYDFESRRLDLPIHVAKAYETLLAATAEPTDEELAGEAVERANDVHGTVPTNYDTRLAIDALRSPRDVDQWSNTVRDYIAGARREGQAPKRPNLSEPFDWGTPGRCWACHWEEQHTFQGPIPNDRHDCARRKGAR